MIIRLGLVVLLGISCLVGCTKAVTVEVRGAAVEEVQPTVGRICPYPGSSPSSDSPGPYIAITLFSESDLEAICRKKKVHHLYFNLLACSSEGSEADLLSGSVFRVSESDDKRTADTYKGWYKVYVPTSLKEVSKRALVIGSVDLRKELDAAEKSGLCVSLGGANMLGFGVRSNLVCLPVRVANDLLIIESDQRF